MADGGDGFVTGAEAWRRDMPSRHGAFRCVSPLLYAFEGEVRHRSCGRCRACFARAKRDRAARAAAEAATAVEVIGLTLTYAVAPEDFPIGDVQRFLKRWRRQLWRDALRRLGLKERGRKTEDDKARIAAEVPRLFYLRVGERGARNGRRHFHLAVFADKPTGVRPSARKAPKRGERVGAMIYSDADDFWPHGHYTVDVMPGGAADPQGRLFSPVELIRMARSGERPVPHDPDGAVRLARYLCKYLDKARAPVGTRFAKRQQRDVVFGSSNRRPLGHDYIAAEARRYAQAGLPFPGTYTVPGLRFSAASRVSGKVKDGRVKLGSGAWISAGSEELQRAIRAEWVASQSPRHTLSGIFGAMRWRAIAAYRDEWQKLRGEVPMPPSDFCHWYDPDRAEGDYRQIRRHAHEWAKRPVASAAVPLPPWRDPSRRRRLHISVDGQWLGMIRVYDTGTARWLPAKGDPVFLPRGDLSRELPELSQVERQKIEERLRRIRGPGWLTPIEWKAAAQAKLAGMDDALMRAMPPGELRIAEGVPPVRELTGVFRGIAMSRLAAGDGVPQHHRRIMRQWQAPVDAGASAETVERFDFVRSHRDVARRLRQQVTIGLLAQMAIGSPDRAAVLKWSRR